MGPDRETHRVFPALCERGSKTGSARDRKVSAYPGGREAPFGRLTRPHQGPRSCLTPAGRALAECLWGTGPMWGPDRMASVNWAGSENATRFPGPVGTVEPDRISP